MTRVAGHLPESQGQDMAMTVVYGLGCRNNLEDGLEVFEEELPAREVVARNQPRPLPRGL